MEHPLAYPNFGKPIQKAFLANFVLLVNDPVPLPVHGCLPARCMWASAPLPYD